MQTSYFELMKCILNMMTFVIVFSSIQLKKTSVSRDPSELIII